tara:strand:- start:169 stop:648 length:480 start_codon:yes stop_codon:yes gene_type:complete
MNILNKGDILQQETKKSEEISVSEFKSIKKLENFILYGEDLKTKIDNHPRVISYLSDHTDGSTWYGADVLVVFRKTLEMKHWVSRSSSHHLVETKHAKGIAWVFIVLSNIYVDKIDSITKYFFYADLAEAANLYLERSTGEVNLKGLLLEIVRCSKKYL